MLHVELEILQSTDQLLCVTGRLGGIFEAGKCGSALRVQEDQHTPEDIVTADSYGDLAPVRQFVPNLFLLCKSGEIDVTALIVQLKLCL